MRRHVTHIAHERVMSHLYLRQEVAVWRASAVGAGAGVRWGVEDGARELNERDHVDTLARLSSQWASTCSDLAHLPLHDRAGLRGGGDGGGGGRERTRGVAVACARQLVGDVAVLQQEMMLVISQVCVCVCVCVCVGVCVCVCTVGE